MRNALDHLSFINQVASRSPFGLITDFDGTLSEIAPHPQEAAISPVCRHHLASLVQRIALVAVLSGRDAKDVKERVGLDGITYVGLHGLQRWEKGSVRLWEGAKGYPDRINAVLNELETPLSRMPGVNVENKGPVASIHYRLAPDQEAAHREILQILKGSPKVKELDVSLGRMVVELKPPLRVDKGSVLRELVENYGLRGAICLGDDVTDLDAFSVIREPFPGRPFIGVAIAVEDAETFKEVKEGADYSLGGIREVERFLEWLDTDPGYTSTRHRPAHE